MANWADVTYKISGEKKQIDKLESVLEELYRMEEPFVQNGFGNLWLGCIVSKLGGDWNEVYCRGNVDEFNRDGDVITMYQSTAWDEMSEFRHFLESALPGIEIYFYCEESGMCIYKTNDFDGEYFPERYHIEGLDCSEYYNDLEDAARCIEEMIAAPLEPNEKSIENGLEKYNASIGEDSDEQLYFYKIRLVGD